MVCTICRQSAFLFVSFACITQLLVFYCVSCGVFLAFCLTSTEGNKVDKVHLLLLFLSWVVYLFCIKTLLIMEKVVELACTVRN